MGGRGGSGGKSVSNVAGLRVTVNGETVSYYFHRMDGQNYYQRGISGIPEQTPGNMSISDFRKRVISNGAEVKTISMSEKRKAEIARQADRKETDKLLDRAYASDKIFVRGSRAARKYNRATKRNRRK